MLDFWCLTDFQMEIPGRQLVVKVWNPWNRDKLEVYIQNSLTYMWYLQPWD